MKKKRAIKLLKQHKAKLKDLSRHNSNWYAMLADMLLKYIGAESMLYKSAKEWYSYAEKGSREHLDMGLEIVDNAIEFVEVNGLYRPPNQNFLSTMSDKALVTLIVFVLSITSSGSFFAGKFLTDLSNKYEKEQLLKENAALRLLFPNSNEHPNQDTTGNASGGIEKKNDMYHNYKSVLDSLPVNPSFDVPTKEADTSKKSDKDSTIKK